MKEKREKDKKWGKTSKRRDTEGQAKKEEICRKIKKDKTEMLKRKLIKWA